MTKKKPTDIASSVLQRLLNMIRKTGDDPNLVWSRYATERFLYRLSVSEYSSDFILKGAMLFMVWMGRLYRPTVDLDLLGYGEDSSKRIETVFRNVCSVDVEPDGLTFDPDTVKATPIRGNQGQRVTLVAFLGNARIPVQVDVGFGDVVTPRAKKINYPTLLDFPAPRIRACPRETVIAEKLHTMVMLGIVNSRMKDFHDLYVLAQEFAFDGATLAQAIRSTFQRRKTDIPAKTPLALTDEFGQDNTKTIQWNAFIRKSGLQQESPDLLEVLSQIRKFLLPLLKAVSGQGPTPKNWEAGGSWHNR